MNFQYAVSPNVAGIGMTSQRVRDRLVDRLSANGIWNQAVLQAMRSVPRHIFVDEVLASRAYDDSALPIGYGQTISQPWVVARMTEGILGINPTPTKVLEIGTGSGYQAAILASLGIQVFTIERIGGLLRQARKRFRSLGLDIRSKHDDGYLGWAEYAPFDAIIITAAAPTLVGNLQQQLAGGGRLIAPVGSGAAQSLLQWDLSRVGTAEQTVLAPAMFVPMLAGVLD